MLVITRKPNEKLQIGDDITVQVVDIKEGSVFLDITLPSGTMKCEVMSENEEIEITEEVKVRVAVIQTNRKVRLGVIAPRSMEVRRIKE